jgi:hypothetical protein
MAKFDIKLSIAEYSAIMFCFDRIGEQEEIYTEDIIINDIIETLKDNEILFDEDKFRKQSNNVMFCILLLLHLKTLKTEESHEDLPYCSILYNHDDELNDRYLGLYGITNTPEGDDIKIAFPLISTNLLLKQYCDEELLFDITHSDKGNEITRLLEFNNFKLSYSEKTKKILKML